MNKNSDNVGNDDGNDDSGNNVKEIMLEDFQNPVNKWTTLNDPVMGGQSWSELEIDTKNGVAKFTGECAIVPKLNAPGFITMETGNQILDERSKFPDISTCTAFKFVLKTNTDYDGYRVSFGKAHVPGGRFAWGYKAPLSKKEGTLPPVVGEFGSVIVNFTRFSDKWNDATGEIETECADDPSYCPSEQWLKSMETMSFWAEGVEGSVDLEVKTISAIGCNATASETPVTPSVITSNIHTIGSNPFYMVASITVLAVSTCIIGCCFLCCCIHFRRRRRLNEIKSTTSGTTETDTPYADDFVDEPDDDDNNEMYGTVTMKTYKTNYDVEPGESIIDGEPCKVTTKFKLEKPKLKSENK